MTNGISMGVLLMTRRLMFTILFSLLAALLPAVASADPVKWSAPMNQYPNQWTPTAAPPNYYNNPYGYYYPSGYSPYGVSQGYGSYGGYQSPQQGYYPGGGFSGNPYHPYYYGQ
jgi:hypothetical protein